MEVAEKNDIQSSRIKACSFHHQQGCRHEVHEEEPSCGFDEICTLDTPAVTERIATAENMKFHNFLASSSIRLPYRLDLHHLLVLLQQTSLLTTACDRGKFQRL